MPDVRETIKRNVIAAVKAITRAADVQRTDAQTWLIRAGMKNGAPLALVTFRTKDTECG